MFFANTVTAVICPNEISPDADAPPAFISLHVAPLETLPLPRIMQLCNLDAFVVSLILRLSCRRGGGGRTEGGGGGEPSWVLFPLAARSVNLHLFICRIHHRRRDKNRSTTARTSRPRTVEGREGFERGEATRGGGGACLPPPLPIIFSNGL